MKGLPREPFCRVLAHDGVTHLVSHSNSNQPKQPVCQLAPVMPGIIVFGLVALLFASPAFCAESLKPRQAIEKPARTEVDRTRHRSSACQHPQAAGSIACGSRKTVFRAHCMSAQSRHDRAQHKRCG